MRRGLVRHHIRNHTADCQLRVNVRCISNQANGEGFLLVFRLLHQGHCFFKGVHHQIHIANFLASARPRRVHLDHQTHAAIHGDCQWLGSPHSTQSGGQNKFPRQGTPAALHSKCSKGFIGSLQDALGTDINPRPGSHLTKHN